MTHLIRVVGAFALLFSSFTVAAASIPPPSLSSADSSRHTAVAQAARAAMPAVVSIKAIKNRMSESDLKDLFGFGAPNDQAPDQEPGQGPNQEFGQAPEQGPGGMQDFPPSHPMLGMASGVIVRPDGLIVTNNHVVENAEKITVAIGENQKFKAHIIGADPKTDIALLKLENAPKNLPTLAFGNSDEVEVGDWAIAIGSPFGLARTVTSGIVSAKGRGEMGVYDIEDFIQTDAAINPGNSGGPLLNIKGEMIGLNAAIYSETGGSMGIGFAISSKLVKNITNDLTQYGRVVRGWIGVTAQDLDESLAKYFKAPNNKGALIAMVEPDGPAAKGSIRIGDVVIRFGNQQVEDSAKLRTLVTKAKSGTETPITLLRSGKQLQVNLKISEQPSSKKPGMQQAGQLAKKEEGPPFGLSVRDIPDELRSLLGTEKSGGAIVIKVQPGSVAFDAGITPGDVIIKANDEKIQSAKDFAKFTKKASKSDNVAVLYIQKGPKERAFVPLNKSDEQ